MASLKSKKEEVLNKISATRTLTDNYPKIVKTNVFQSISNNSNELDFTNDLLKALGIIDKLEEIINDLLINSLDDVENSVKRILKENINDTVSCSCNPSITEEIKFEFPVKDIDINGLLKINPQSNIGKYIYFDQYNDTFKDTQDFNTFLYYVVNKSNGIVTWKGDNHIVDIEFIEQRNDTNFSIENNLFIVKTPESYINSGKTIRDWNNDMINSIKLFNSTELATQIFDKIFGNISLSLNKTTNQLLLEAEVNKIIENIFNSTGDNIETVYDQSNDTEGYYKFTNDELYQMLEDATNRRNAQFKFNDGNNKYVTLSNEFLEEQLDKIMNASMEFLTTDKNNLTTEILNNVVNEIFNTNNVTITTNESDNNTLNNNSISQTDKYTFRLSLISDILKELTLSITNIIISPKVFLIFAINVRLMGYKESIDFNKVFNLLRGLLIDIVSGIKNEIMEYIQKEIILEVEKIAISYAQKLAKEAAKSVQDQLKSLLGGL